MLSLPGAGRIPTGRIPILLNWVYYDVGDKFDVPGIFRWPPVEFRLFVEPIYVKIKLNFFPFLGFETQNSKFGR